MTSRANPSPTHCETKGMCTIFDNGNTNFHKPFYWGRTAKHGAYMGGADFVQWHGNHELLKEWVEFQEMATELREKDKKETPSPEA